MERFIIDRFEGEYAVCETEEMYIINISRKAIPKEAKEGDVLISEGGVIKISAEETEENRDRIKAKMDKLFKK